MKKIILFAFWFGDKLPDNFEIWLRTAQFNSTINFVVFSNISFESELPQNVNFISTTYLNFEERIMNYFHEEIHYDNPYKICETRPFWGEIFTDLVKEYDFWGTVDLDIVMGDLQAFITNDILENYDRILTRDHLTLYRCSAHLPLKLFNHGFQDIPEIGEVMREKTIFAFGEWPGASTIFLRQGIRQYDERIVDDIWHLKKNFRSADEIWDSKKDKIRRKGVNLVFMWIKGKLFELSKVDGTISRKEVAYIHLQKRKMTIENNDNNFIKLLIIPNKYIIANDLEPSIIEKDISEGFRTRFFYKKYFDDKLSKLYRKVKRN